MPAEQGDVRNDLEKSNRSELENAMGLSSKMILLSLKLEDMDKLHKLMEKRGHFTVNQTLMDLINTAFGIEV